MKFLISIVILITFILFVFPETIYEIQYTENASGDSPYNGKTVTVSGIVTRTFGSYFFIQDAPEGWHGVMVYDNTASVTDGDSITLTGDVSEYYNKTEISNVSSYTIHSSGNAIPGPVVVNTGDIAQEKYEGVFVKVENVVVQTTQNSYDEWNINDGTGECTVDESPYAPYSYNPVIGDTLMYIMGIVDYDFSAFKLFPVNNGDILKTVDGSGEARVNPKYALTDDTLNLRIDIVPSVDTIYGKLSFVRLLINADTLDSIKIIGDGEIDTSKYSVSFSNSQYTIDINYDLIDSLKVYAFGYVFTGNDSIKIYTGVSPAYFLPVSVLPTIKELPTMDMISIEEAQKTYDGYNSIYNNQTITVKGVVTGPSSIFSPTSTSTGFYIEDSTGGINIYSSSDAQNSSFTLGMELIITGTITEYNGVTELKYSAPETDIIIINDTIANVEPTVLSNSQSINEANEGRLVKVEYGKVQTSPVDAGSGKNFQIYNGLSIIDVRIGDKTDMYSNNDLLDKIKPGILLNVTGIAGQYDKTNPYTSGYQLLVRFDSDIEFVETPEDSSYSIAVYPNPVNFDNGETARIVLSALNSDRVNAILLDLSGRKIATLLENAYGAQTVIWNGTDFQGRKVNIGAYILIVDIMDNQGHTKRIKKPIIVTTNLK